MQLWIKISVVTALVDVAIKVVNSLTSSSSGKRYHEMESRFWDTYKDNPDQYKTLKIGALELERFQKTQQENGDGKSKK